MIKSHQNLRTFAGVLVCGVIAAFQIGCVPPDHSDSDTTFSAATPASENKPSTEDATEVAASTTDPQAPRPTGNNTAATESDEPGKGAENVAAAAPNEDATSQAKSPTEQSEPQQHKPIVKNSKPAKVTFDNLVIGMQKDIAFRPFMMTEEAKSLVGQVIQIPGYMAGGVSKVEGLKKFILLRNTECKFGPGGQADHLIQIQMKQGKTTSYSDKMLYVQGTLEFKPFQGPDGNTWSIYEINDGAVVRGSRF